MKTAIFGIYGKSNTGKTALIVDIINKLSEEGFKIASMKISDKKLDIDTKGKDSWKHAKAGSKLVVLSSKNETDFLLKTKIGIKQIVKQICNIDNFDLILVEGANDKSIPKIKIGDIENRENTVLTYNGDFKQLINMIREEILRRKNMEKINIKVNGKEIYLTDFPTDFIINTICGILQSLKGVDEIKDVEIKFEL